MHSHPACFPVHLDWIQASQLPASLTPCVHCAGGLPGLELAPVCWFQAPRGPGLCHHSDESGGCGKVSPDRGLGESRPQGRVSATFSRRMGVGGKGGPWMTHLGSLFGSFLLFTEWPRGNSEEVLISCDLRGARDATCESLIPLPVPRPCKGSSVSTQSCPWPAKDSSTPHPIISDFCLLDPFSTLHAQAPPLSFSLSSSSFITMPGSPQTGLPFPFIADTRSGREDT